MTPTDKKNLLINEIKKYKRVAVAFSGGVDSTFLLKMCIDALGSSTARLFRKGNLTKRTDFAQKWAQHI